MGRHREYDEAAALTGALHVFRRAGYAGVSIRELETATGLHAGSIYNSYTDKAGLFAAALAHYNDTVLRRRIAAHAPPGAGLRGLRRLFLTLTDEPPEHTYGCLITNTAIEHGGPTPVPRPVTEGLTLLQETFGDRTAEAADSGEVATSVDRVHLAARLLALYQGVLVLLRAGWPHAAVIDLINATFDELETP